MVPMISMTEINMSKKKVPILEQIEHIDTGKREYPMRPLSLTVIKEVDQLPTTAYDVDLLYRHELRLGCHTRVTATERGDPMLRGLHERKVTRMFAECLYKDVVDDLHDILVYSFENVANRELEGMVGDLIKRLRP